MTAKSLFRNVNYTHYFLAILSGFLLFLSAPSAISYAPLAWIALIPLLAACAKVEPKRAALFGLISGVTYHALLLYWIIIVLAKYGGVAFFLAVLALFLLALYMSLYTALFAFGISWFSKRSQAFFGLAPLLWVSLDFFRSRLFTGFPWQDLGYSQYQHPLLIQAADLAGHYGITFLIVLVNYMGLNALRYYRNKEKHLLYEIATGFAIIVTVFSYNVFRFDQVKESLSGAPSTTITIVQGNIPQDQKWSRFIQKATVDKYIGLAESAIQTKKPDLIIWPETALPFFPKEHRLFPELISSLITKHQVALLTGAPHREVDPSGKKLKYFNSSFLINETGQITGRYDKQHLVPFGEYIPLRSVLFFFSPVVETLADFTPGENISLVASGKANIGTLICYESIFPELVRQQTVGGANLLAVLTNDAWYGRSSAPLQHFSMAVFRAVENRRSVARAANTGISGFIDPLGRVSKKTPIFEDFYLTDEVRLLNGQTFFMRFGHYFPWICVSIVAVTFIATRRKKPSW